MNRREFLKQAATAAGATMAFRDSPTHGATSRPALEFEPGKNLIPAPRDPSQWADFRRALQEWRPTQRATLSYSDALYRRPDFAWVTGNFSCCFVMLCDELFYDPAQGRYTVDRFLEEGRREFGGYDSVVLWHAYPRIGLDDRNQFDFYRDMPGGLKGLRAAVDDLHRQAVRVFLDYNPWDTGTRREGQPDLDALCHLVAQLDADGIFLDTMDRGAAEFRAKLDAVRPGVILESEGALPLERVHDHHASWAQQFEDSTVPGILRNKWFERRHLQHQIRRWATDHTGELHSAWMNGSGMLVWENVFGSWIPWSQRDRSILRSMLPIQRRFASLFCGEGWTPLVAMRAPDVYASLWESNGIRLWTLVNGAERAVEGELPDLQLRPGERWFDLITGEATTKPVVRIAPRGIGCLLAGVESGLGPDFRAFLLNQRRLAERASLDTASPRRETRIIPVTPTERLLEAPAGMAEIGPAHVTLSIQMRNRECGFYESMPPAGHRLWDSYQFSVQRFGRELRIARLAFDLTPVTNQQFAEFLKASGYQPRHSENFLKHWSGGVPPAGKEDHPVVYVDLTDARAYARWAGKRLPTEEEWQYAAQGPDGRVFPWGNQMEAGRCNGGEGGGTTPVRQFPEGRSPFGVYDLCGNVWEWTESERTDGRTRFCIVRGGSFYHAQGSGWYMDGGPRPVDFAAKFLLLWPGLDRCATVGFRCVLDLAS